jgi:hypothetical protein
MVTWGGSLVAPRTLTGEATVYDGTYKMKTYLLEWVADGGPSARNRQR